MGKRKITSLVFVFVGYLGTTVVGWAVPTNSVQATATAGTAQSADAKGQDALATLLNRQHVINPHISSGSVNPADGRIHDRM